MSSSPGPETREARGDGIFRRYRPFWLTLGGVLLLAGLMLAVSRALEFLDPFTYTLF